MINILEGKINYTFHFFPKINIKINQHFSPLPSLLMSHTHTHAIMT